MSSSTFKVHDISVTVRTRKETPPTGLASIGWKSSGDNITVVVGGKVFPEVGSFMSTGKGRYAFCFGNVTGLWTHYNSLNKDCTAPYPPFSYANETFAFKHACRWIKSQLEGEVFVP